MDISQLRKVMAFIREKIGGKLLVSQIEIMLMVAEKEGINIAEIAEQTNELKVTVKRDIRRLTNLLEGGDYVMVEDGICIVKDDGSVFLSETGKRFIKDLSMVS